MKFQRAKFSKELDVNFSRALKQRVNDYFKENNISKYGDGGMIFKSVFVLSVYLIPLGLLYSGMITNTWAIFSMWILMGLGMGGIGLCIQHDAIHGSYSNNKTVNRFMSYTMNIIGGSAIVWKIQHNVLHHTFTNIDSNDDDINTPPFLRFSPHGKKRWIHKFQHIYVWFFYGLSTISWVTTKDFVNITRYYKKGLLKDKKDYRTKVLQILGWKLFYYLTVLVIPMIVLPISPWLVLLFFLCMHYVTGMILSLIFQPAHVITTTEFPLPNEEGRIENNWTVHQMLTTTNFAPKNRVLTYLVGGLNYQVEHHLFSNVCHVHYPRISSIVKQTAEEFGIPYNSQKTFIGAIINHGKMLKKLGTMDPVAEVNISANQDRPVKAKAV